MSELPSPRDVFGYFGYWQGRVDPVIKQYLGSEKGKKYAATQYGAEVLGEVVDLTLRGGTRQRVAYVAATFGVVRGDFDDLSVKAIADAAAGGEVVQTHVLLY